MLDALKRYTGALSGFAEIPKQRAERIASALAKQGLISSDQARSLATDLVRRSRQNRERVREIVRRELPKLGLATRDEVDRLRQRIAALEANQRAGRAAARSPAPRKTATRKATTGTTRLR